MLGSVIMPVIPSPATSTGSAWGAEAPPPGAGLATVIETVAAIATSLAGMAAVSEVGVTNVVDRSAPFQRTTEEVVNPVPVTVSVNADCVCTGVGASDAIVGTGFFSA